MSATEPALADDRAEADPAAPRGFDGRAAWIWLLVLSTVLLLALKGGGYDLVVRSEMAIVVWWVVLLGALAGVLAHARPSRRALTAVGLLLAFTAWSALATTWTISTELTVDEISRLVAYVGVLALAVMTFGDRAAAMRHVAGALGCAIAIIAALAVLSRLRPGLFPGASQTATLLPDSRRRLSWPLDYWNALAALMALGLPLLLASAASARRVAARAAAGAALPVVLLCVYLTYSRAGALAAMVGTVAFLALAPERVPKLLVAAIAAGGSAVLIASVATHHAVAGGVLDAAAHREGTTLLIETLGVCAVAAALTAAVGVGARRGVVPRTVSMPWASRHRGSALAVTAVALVAAFFAASGPSHVRRAWRDFRQPPDATLTATGIDRFSSLSGNDRYLYWRAAVQGLRGHWFTGSGPGTYVDVWQPRATASEVILNAHSLYIETLSDLGIVGLVLLAGFLLSVLAAAFMARRAEPGESPSAIAAASLAFCVSAAFDWIWQVPVLPVALLLLTGSVLAGPPAARASGRGGSLGLRLAVATTAVVALLVIAVPLAATTAVRSSQRHAARGELNAALADARTASRVAGYAGSPHMQAALVLELAHDLPAALVEARTATVADPRNAEYWLVRSRLEAEDGLAGAAVASFRRARALDPISLLTRL